MKAKGIWLSLLIIVLASAIVIGKNNPPPPPPPCGGNGENCCSGTSCNSGLVCLTGKCQVPPPCFTYSPGCYDQRDEFSSFGTLTIDEFKIYYSQQACIEGNPEKCKCTVPATAAGSGQRNPDDSNQACSCIAESFWDTTKRCCDKSTDKYCVGSRGCFQGKDQGNCGTDNCVGPTQFNDFGQVTVTDNEGCTASGSDTGKCGEDLALVSACSTSTLTTYRCTGQDSEKKTVDCNAYDSTNENRPVVSGQPSCDGQCGNGGVCSARDYSCASGGCAFDPVNLDTSELWCSSCDGTEWQIGGPQEAEHACCGDDADEYITAAQGDLADGTLSCCPSSTDCSFNSNCFSSGSWSNTSNNFYCDNSVWKDGDSSQESCVSGGKSYTWTGTRCCGDDSGEYYNEPNRTIACWNGIPVFSRNYVTSNTNPVQKEVMSINGTFEGCKTDSGSIAALRDSITSTQLVHSNPLCTVLPNGFQQGQHAFCSAAGIWNRSAELKNSLKTFPWDNAVAQKTECCTQEQCWDGFKCLNDQSTSASSTATNGQRCINGEWSESPVKKNWDETATGFCPKKSQCLVNPGSKNSRHGLLENFTQDFSVALNNNIQCINDTQYIGDNYCEDGNWSSRTKLLAIAMLDNAEISSGADYTLYCDTFTNVLNNYEYSLPSGFSVKTDVIASCSINGSQLPCANNFCVIRQGSKVLLGTTLNTVINKQPSILETFDLPASFCNNALVNDGQFHACSSPIVWYDNREKAVILSQTPISLTPQLNFLEKFVQLVKQPFALLFGKVLSAKPAFEGIQVDLTFLNNVKKFNRLYITRAGDKSVKGVIETVGGDSYVSIEYTKPEASICSIVTTMNKQALGANVLFCDESGATTLVSSRYQVGSQVWQDLTSKLRPQLPANSTA